MTSINRQFVREVNEQIQFATYNEKCSFWNSWAMIFFIEDHVNLKERLDVLLLTTYRPNLRALRRSLVAEEINRMYKNNDQQTSDKLKNTFINQYKERFYLKYKKNALANKDREKCLTNPIGARQPTNEMDESILIKFECFSDEENEPETIKHQSNAISCCKLEKRFFIQTRFTSAVNKLVGLDKASRSVKQVFWRYRAWRMFVSNDAKLRRLLDERCLQRRLKREKKTREQLNNEIGKTEINRIYSTRNLVEIQAAINAFVINYRQYIKDRFTPYSTYNFKNLQELVGTAAEIRWSTEKYAKFWEMAFALFEEEERIPIFHQYNDDEYMAKQRAKYIPDYIDKILKYNDANTFDNLVAKFLKYKVKILRKLEEM
jgi:hypothetical protein